MDRFDSVGIIQNTPDFDKDELEKFFQGVASLRAKGKWDKNDIVGLYFQLLPEFAHKETGKYLDERM